MRVLTVGNLYPPHHFGGYELAWQGAVRHLRGSGHEVRVLAVDYRHPGVADGDEPDVDRRLRWYWHEHDFERIGRLARVRLERHNHALLHHHLRTLRPEVVSFWSMGGGSHSLIEDVRRRGLPMVNFMLDEWLGYGRSTDQWLRQFYGRRAVLAPLAERLTGIPATVDYDAAGRYVFASEFIRRRTLTENIALSDTAVAPCGFDPSFIRDDAADWNPPWRWRLLHVGRLHPDKGIEDAVRALALLPQEATLTFAGTWDARDERALEHLIAELGLGERVRLLGHLPRPDVRALFPEHDALLFPVRWDEPWGMVPLEAMAQGCPVIATGRGGSGEYLRSGENCVLIPAHNPDALAAAVHLLEGDPDLRRRLRAGGAKTAPQYTETAFNAAVARHLAEAA